MILALTLLGSLCLAFVVVVDIHVSNARKRRE